MTISSAAMRALLAAGATPEMLIAAVEADEAEVAAKAEERRRRAREKKRRQRERNRPPSPSVPGDTRDEGGHSGQPLPLKERSPLHPPKENNPLPSAHHDQPSVDRVERAAHTRKTTIPDNFEPDLAEGVRLGLTSDLAATAAIQFTAHHRANGTLKASWPDEWVAWCVREAKKIRNGKPLPHDAIFGALAEIASTKWIGTDDWRWPRLALRHFNAHNRRPHPNISRNRPGGVAGYSFPAEWVAELDTDERASA